MFLEDFHCCPPCHSSRIAATGVMTGRGGGRMLIETAMALAAGDGAAGSRYCNAEGNDIMEGVEM